MNRPNYYNKIVILFIATFANIFIMWYFLVREESVDWISSQIIHQASPYAMTVAEDGKVIIDNVILGYGFVLPKGFETAGAKNLSFYIMADGGKKCEIKHYYVRADKAGGEAADTRKMIIPFRSNNLIFELTGSEADKSLCAGYLKQIKDSLTREQETAPL
ncbi:MAG: hypothetical protein PHS62_02315 [Patescibacteria group bacterium]|nr:hypothetical protein [Patescibacteria group bacterium]